MFGGNSNWRGPIWMPVNALIIRALLQYHSYYGDDVHGRVPDRLGPPDDALRGRRRDRPPAGGDLPARRRRAIARSSAAPASSRTTRTGATTSCSTSTSTATTAPGLGASHQTGWTGIIARSMHLFATTTGEQFVDWARGPSGLERSCPGRAEVLVAETQGEVRRRRYSSDADAISLVGRVALVLVDPSQITLDRFSGRGVADREALHSFAAPDEHLRDHARREKPVLDDADGGRQSDRQAGWVVDRRRDSRR